MKRLSGCHTSLAVRQSLWRKGWTFDPGWHLKEHPSKNAAKPDNALSGHRKPVSTDARTLPAGDANDLVGVVAAPLGRAFRGGALEMGIFQRVVPNRAEPPATSWSAPSANPPCGQTFINGLTRLGSTDLLAKQPGLHNCITTLASEDIPVRGLVNPCLQLRFIRSNERPNVVGQVQ